MINRGWKEITLRSKENGLLVGILYSEGNRKDYVIEDFSVKGQIIKSALEAIDMAKNDKYK